MELCRNSLTILFNFVQDPAILTGTAGFSDSVMWQSGLALLCACHILSYLSRSRAYSGASANLEVRFNLDPFGKKSDEDLLGDNFWKFEEGTRALADLRGMLQLQELWEAFAEFTASLASVTEVDSI